MRTCGAGKLPWLVIEVEVDAERAECFAEQQLRLVVSSAKKRRYLKLVIGSVDLQNERRQGYE